MGRRLKARVLIAGVALLAVVLAGCNPERANANYVKVLKAAGASVSWCQGAENVPSTAGLSNYVSCGTATTSFVCKTTAQTDSSGLRATSSCAAPGGGVSIRFYTSPSTGRDSASWRTARGSGSVWL